MRSYQYVPDSRHSALMLVRPVLQHAYERLEKEEIEEVMTSKDTGNKQPFQAALVVWRSKRTTSSVSLDVNA